jgi:hypothetical protein
MSSCFTFIVTEPKYVNSDIKYGPVAGGTKVTVQGEGFMPTTRAYLGGVEVAFHYINGAWGTFTTPPHADPGKVALKLVNADGKNSTATNVFNYNLPPRDPYIWPFAQNSIWNMPIGSNAVFASANLRFPASETVADPNVRDPVGFDYWLAMPAAEIEYLIFQPSAPTTKVYYNKEAWDAKNYDRCEQRSGIVMYEVPFPTDYNIEHSNRNAGTSILLADGKTIAQFQPTAKCKGYSYATAHDVKYISEDIKGDGILGAHGGSDLSTLGGTIRVGELRPGAPIRHALKMTFASRRDYGLCTNDKDSCHTWPAIHADSYAANEDNGYGSETGNTNYHMKLGALLAIPPTVDINNMGLKSVPGKMLAWTLQNYGTYIVDSNSKPIAMMSVEEGPGKDKRAEFLKDWGFDFEGRLGAGAKKDPLTGNYTPQALWIRDVRLIVQALKVVTNNSPTSIGGGGTPRQPLAPANFSR